MTIIIMNRNIITISIIITVITITTAIKILKSFFIIITIIKSYD